MVAFEPPLLGVECSFHFSVDDHVHKIAPIIPDPPLSLLQDCEMLTHLEDPHKDVHGVHTDT